MAIFINLLNIKYHKMVTPQDFSLWTREQRQEFNNYMDLAFKPTLEEIAEQERIQKENMINRLIHFFAFI